MKKAEYRDSSYQIKYDNNETYRQKKPGYQKTIARNTKQQKSKYLFKLDKMASKKPITTLLPYFFLHEETLTNPSHQCLLIFLQIYQRLKNEAQFMNESQIQQLIFGQETQENRNLIKRVKQSYGEKTTQQFVFKQSDPDMKDLLTRNNRFTMTDSQLRYYQRGCKKSIMALFPEQISTRKLLLKKLFKQLAPMYGLTLTSNNCKQGEDQQIFIVADQYDRKQYIRELFNTKVQKNGKEQKQQKQQDSLEFVVSLEDIVFWLKLGEIEEFKQINMSWLTQKLVKDLTKQLILYYSLTKKRYPSLNPLNIHFNTYEKVFLLSVEGVLIDGLGFDFNNFPIRVDYQELTNKMQYYHQQFINHKTAQNEFQGVLLNAAFLFNKVSDLILIDYAEAPWQVGNMMDYLKTLKDKQKKWDNISSVFEANEQQKYGALGIDMHYKDHQVYWLKYQICEHIYKNAKQKSFCPKIKTLKYLYCLCTAVYSPKNKQKGKMLKLFQSIKNTIEHPVDYLRDKSQQDQLDSPIKEENHLWKYYRYLKSIHFGTNQSNIQITRMHYLNFLELERNLLEQTRKYFDLLKNQKPMLKILIMYNLLERLHEDNLDQLTFNVYNQILKPKEHKQLQNIAEYVSKFRKRI